MFIHEVISLVDPPRENWNLIFSDLERLSDRLVLLGIDTLMESGDA